MIYPSECLRAANRRVARAVGEGLGDPAQPFCGELFPSLPGKLLMQRHKRFGSDQPHQLEGVHDLADNLLAVGLHQVLELWFFLEFADGLLSDRHGGAYVNGSLTSG